MSVTAHRVRVTPDGRLDTEDDLASLLGVLRVMAGTTRTHWAHAPWFGLHELFVEAGRQHRQDHEALRDAINAAFRELGVEGFQVTSVSTGDPDPARGMRPFALVLEDREGRAHFGSLDPW